MNKEQPKQKKYYDVKVEALTTTHITYRVLADDENDALEQIKKKAPTSVRPIISLRNIIKASVYESGSSIIRLIKNYRR
jgi:hypothetical protein